MADGYGERQYERKTRTISDKERRRQEAFRMQKKGLKKFIIDGEEVWALNEKNAIRKSKKTA